MVFLGPQWLKADTDQDAAQILKQAGVSGGWAGLGCSDDLW